MFAKRIKSTNDDVVHQSVLYSVSVYLNSTGCGLWRCLHSPHCSAEFALFNDGATLGVRWHLEINAITSATPGPTGWGPFSVALGPSIPSWHQTSSHQLYPAHSWPSVICLPLPASLPHFFHLSASQPICHSSGEPTPPCTSLLLLLLLLEAIESHWAAKPWNSLRKVNSRESINNLWGSILLRGESREAPS